MYDLLTQYKSKSKKHKWKKGNHLKFKSLGCPCLQNSHPSEQRALLTGVLGSICDVTQRLS